jgi:polysaccharide biosynthesis protein PslH
MKRILYAHPFLPWPPVTGGKRVSLATLREVCEGSEVDLLCFDHEIGPGDAGKLRQHCPGLRNIFEIPYYRRSRAWLFPMNLIGKSYFLHRDASREYRDKAEKLVREGNYDLLLSDTLRVFVNVAVPFSKRPSGTPWVAQFHNVEHLLFQRFLDRRSRLKPLLWLESGRLKQAEFRYWKLPDRAIFISPEDHRQAMDITGRWPHLIEGFPGEMLEPDLIGWRGGKEGRICHLGTGTWGPNIDGVKWFLESVFPLIRKQFPQAAFFHAGNATDSRLKRHDNGNDISIQGFLPDLTSFYRDAAVFVAPLRYGSGIKIKVLDAISRGIPVVLTSIANEGLSLNEEDGVFVADEAEEFAEKVLMLLLNPELRIRQGQLAFGAAKSMARMSRRKLLLFEEG